VFCGYKNTQRGDKLSPDEIKKVIEQFSDLGGKSIKILGEGEPLLRRDILEIYEYIYGKRLQPVLFTCGDVIGDNDLAKRIHGLSGENLIQKLDTFGTTIMLKYEAKEQDALVQREGYSKKRDLALERLIRQGFNQHQPTHLGLGIVVLNSNYTEIPRNYEWAIKNNIYPLLCPLMPIGKASNEDNRSELGISQRQMIELSAGLYKIARENGIYVEYPADFPGGLACDISRAGFYIGDTGDIYLCESEEKVGNVRTASLQDMWKEIKKLKDEKYQDNRWAGFCYQKRKAGILPKDFEIEVKRKLLE
jgi:MoaA/NifB/PqqE/SkfB family radical SAM enzyme